MINFVEHLFHVCIYRLYIFFEVLQSFLFLVGCSHYLEFFILDTSCWIYILGMACLFVFVIVPLEKNDLILMKFILWIFKIIYIFCVLFKKYLLNPRPLRMSAVFLQKFYTLCFFIQVFDPFWINFLYCFMSHVRDRVIMFCIWLSICSSTICWKGDHFFIKLFCHLCHKSIALLCLGLFLYPLFLSFSDLCVYLFALPHHLFLVTL